MTEQFAKLHKYCLDELLVSRGYKNQKLSRVIFTSDKMDAITFLFRDNAQFFVFYAKDSLSMVRLSEDYNVKQRLIPDGKPIYDEHYCDVLSCATGSNFVNKEEEFDKWEPFSKKSLDKILSKNCTKLLLDSIELGFGLQHWLTIKLSKKIGSQHQIEIGFKFPNTSVPMAVYAKDDEKIIYCP